MPETRFKSQPEKGTESSSGTVSTEFNIDEQDDWFASVMCQKGWTSEELSAEEELSGITSKKTLKLGNQKTSYALIKKFPQAPVEYRYFKGLQIDKLTLSAALDSFVKLSWDFLGQNYPVAEDEDPVTKADSDCYGAVYGDMLKTKAFKTLSGYLKYGTSLDAMQYLRQSSNFELSISNNKESTHALFETEAVETSDGDFDASGTVDIWKADATATNLLNAGIKGEEMYFEISFDRVIGSTKTSYTFTVKGKLKNPTESKDGSKYKVSLPFSINGIDDLVITKTVQTV